MDRIELKIVALANSTAHQNSYVIVLEETDGTRRLPVMIGMNEAQAIAISLEGMQPSRPLTHDLFKNTLESLRIDLKEVMISELKDNIFFAVLACEKDNGEIIEIDSRTSDAIAMAVRFGCPIFTTTVIMDEAGVEGKISSTKEEEEEEEEENDDQPLEDQGVNSLEQKLKKALAQEDYELAARIRDLIQQKKGDQ
ncbi:MAG: bifunctional nuclease family protein [Bacteroidota bacterium]